MLVFHGVFLALSASLPVYEEKREQRTERGLVASFFGALLLVLGVGGEQMPRISSAWAVICLLVVIYVTGGFAQVAFHLWWPKQASRNRDLSRRVFTVAGAGFEPAKAEPTRLQRVPFDRSGTPPP
jgi:hypothetical protein